MLKGTAQEVRALATILERQGRVEKNGHDPEYLDTGAYTVVVQLGNKRIRLFIDNRTNEGTIKVR